MYKNNIKKSQIPRLETENKILIGHKDCAEFLEQSVCELLHHHAVLDDGAQEELHAEVQPVFTDADDKHMTIVPDGKLRNLCVLPTCMQLQTLMARQPSCITNAGTA